MGGGGWGIFSLHYFFFHSLLVQEFFLQLKPSAWIFFLRLPLRSIFFLDIFPCMNCFCARNFAKLDCLLHVLYRNENSPSGYSRTQPGLQFSLQRSGHWNLPCSDSSLPGSSTARIFSQKKIFFSWTFWSLTLLYAHLDGLIKNIAVSTLSSCSSTRWIFAISRLCIWKWRWMRF